MNRLRKLRLDRRLTLNELAEKVNINRSSIARYEVGEVEMKADVVQLFSSFFNVSTDYFLGNTDNPNSQTIVVAEHDGTLTRIQRELIDATKGLTIEDMEEIFNYVDYIKSKKGNKPNEK